MEGVQTGKNAHSPADHRGRAVRFIGATQVMLHAYRLRQCDVSHAARDPHAVAVANVHPVPGTEDFPKNLGTDQ